MRITRDLEHALLGKAREWTLPEQVTLILFALWMLTFFFCFGLLMYGIAVALLFAWRQWLDVLLWIAISFVVLVFLAWVFYRVCRAIESFCRPKIEEHHP